VDEVFIGSCMTNIGHFRAAGKLLEQHKGTISTRMWIVPPTRMDEHLLMEEGYYSIYGKSGARTEMPGCSLCMGNQARVAANSTVLSTSTRNFPNRLGDGANVYLTSAELAAVGAVLGKLPTPEEYHCVREEPRLHERGDLPLHELRPDRRVSATGGGRQAHCRGGNQRRGLSALTLTGARPCAQDPPAHSGGPARHLARQAQATHAPAHFPLQAAPVRGRRR
jgi:hypothetical protein